MTHAKRHAATHTADTKWNSFIHSFIHSFIKRLTHARAVRARTVRRETLHTRVAQPSPSKRGAYACPFSSCALAPRCAPSGYRRGTHGSRVLLSLCLLRLRRVPVVGVVLVRLDVWECASFSFVGDFATDPLCGTLDGRDHLEGRAEHPVLDVYFYGRRMRTNGGCHEPFHSPEVTGDLTEDGYFLRY